MSTVNLSQEEAIKKMKELAEGARICMMSTSLDARPIPSRPMSLQEVDENGILWFISSKESDKNHELKVDSETQLYFMNNGSSEYLSVYGKTAIYTDQQHKDEHWSKMANAWFDGKEDPNVTIIGVMPEDVRYWAAKHGKFVYTALMAISAVTGNKLDDESEEGKLNV